MHWLINQDLSCCDIDGRLVFLDLALDRYFTLTAPLESVMRSYLSSGTLSRRQREDLEGKAGIVIARALGLHPSIPGLPSPTVSAIESSPAAGCRPAVLPEVAATIWWARRQLRRRPLKAVIEGIAIHRDAKAPPRAHASMTIEPLQDAATQFMRVRRYVPVDPCCLLDSLALLRFLSRRRLHARIVFGVNLVPFAAHCWVQAGGIVLNETLSDAAAHTPIRII